jgi:hypothetical protein
VPSQPLTRRAAFWLTGLGAAGFLASCLFVEQGLRHDALYSDVHVYADYAGRMVDGQVPYRDFSDEYPPLAQPVFLAARIAGEAHYALGFKGLMAVCGIAALACAVATLRAVGAPLARGVALAALFAAAPLLTGPIFLNAYDLWPAFLLALALLLFVRRQPVWAFAVLGAAIAAKLYPVAVLPIAVLAIAREVRVRALAALAAVVVVAHVPFAILGPGGLRYSYVTQAKRGLELNSLGASFLLLFGHPARANEPPGSLNVTGGAADALATVSALLVLGAIVAAALAFTRGRPLLTAAAAAVAGFVAFDKVFSAQYVEWLVPLAPLAGVDAAVGTAVVLGLTRLVFSHRAELARDEDVGLLVARNLAVVALFAVVLLRDGHSRKKADGGNPHFLSRRQRGTRPI